MKELQEGVAKLSCFWNGLDPELRREFRTVPCSGSLDLGTMVEQIRSGAPGLLVVACARDECHHISGNCQAMAATELAGKLLMTSGINPGRIRYLEAPRNRANRSHDVRKAIEELEALGRLERAG